MKKILYVTVVLIFCLAGATLAFALSQKKEANVTIPAEINQPKATISLKAEEKIGKPIEISIPEISVETDIERVGIDDKGRMDIPKDWNNAGWYMHGPSPGEIGSAVIDGHFDAPDGSPSIFYDLDKLRTGSKIQIVDENGKTIEFEVIGKKNYLLSEFPSDLIFNRRDGKFLNLITCSGSWNKDDKNYTHRYVVFAQKID